MITKQVNEYNSSTVLASNYDFNTEELDILFENGAYRYHGVPNEIYKQFAEASSQGSVLSSLIKNGQYRTEKLETSFDEDEMYDGDEMVEIEDDSSDREAE
jgi:hypothetical protein